MDKEHLLQLAQAIGTVFREQKQRLEAAESRLAELGEPVVNVAAPSVSVEAPSVTVEALDLGPLVEAITGREPISLDALVDTIKGLEFPQVDLSELVAATQEANANDALGAIADRVKAGIAQQEQSAANLLKGFSGLADAIQKGTTATQMQFNALVEGQKAQDARIDALTQAITAPKRIIEEDGKPVGVETILKN